MTAAVAELSSVDPSIYTRETSSRVPALVRAAIGACAVTGAVAAVDLLFPKFYWHSDITEIREFTEDTDDMTANCLMVPGLGCKDGLFMAEELSPMPDHAINYFSYGNSGVTPQSVGNTLAAYFDKTHRLPEKFAAHSMGGPVLYSGAEYLLENGYDVPHFDEVNHLTTPFSIQNVRKRGAAHLIANCGYPGGLLGKLTINFLDDAIDNGFAIQRLGDVFMNAVSVAFDKASPRLGLSQMRLLDKTDLTRNIASFRKIITPDTKVRLFIPEQSKSDLVVNNDLACEDWIKWYANFGVQPEIVAMSGAKHADVPKMREYLSKIALTAA